MDPVTVTALALDDGNDTVIYLSCDQVGIHAFMVKMIRDQVRQAGPSVPAEKIIFNATHAHTGGDLCDLPDEPAYDPPRMPSREYQRFFADRAAEAIVEAWDKRQPGQVAWGFGYATTGYSRRTVYFDDTSKRPDAVERPALPVQVNRSQAMKSEASPGFGPG